RIRAQHAESALRPRRSQLRGKLEPVERSIPALCAIDPRRDEDGRQLGRLGVTLHAGFRDQSDALFAHARRPIAQENPQPYLASCEQIAGHCGAGEHRDGVSMLARPVERGGFEQRGRRLVVGALRAWIANRHAKHCAYMDLLEQRKGRSARGLLGPQGLLTGSMVDELAVGRSRPTAGSRLAERRFRTLVLLVNSPALYFDGRALLIRRTALGGGCSYLAALGECPISRFRVPGGLGAPLFAMSSHSTVIRRDLFRI